MRKEIYLIKGNQDESYHHFSERILELSISIGKETGIVKSKIVYTKEAPPSFSVIPFKKGKIAVFSVVSEKKENVELLIKEPGFAGSYLVEEALPVVYNKVWKDGEITPGVCLLTLFKKRKGIDEKTFMHRWHQKHTPLSLKILPLWHYNRNEIKSKLTNSSISWDGIVEEHFRHKSELMNPLKFFGNPWIMFFNMIRVYIDTKSFLDYKTIEPYLTCEIHTKS